MNLITYDLHLWRTWRWESETRYYLVQLKQDLFGQWCLLCSWGGRLNRHGNSQTRYLNSREEADTILQSIGKRREGRGYLLKNLLDTSPTLTDFSTD